MINKYLGGAVLVAAVVALVLFGGADGRDGRDGKDGLGAQPGPDFYQHINLRENFSVGGDGNYYATTSDASTYTLTTTEFRNDKRDSFISWNAGLVAQTFTTMASSSAPLSGLKVGESYSVLWYNASTSGSAAITFAAGTGVDLQEDEGETVVTNGLELARLTFIKKVDTDVIMLVEPFQVGD